MKVDIMTNKNFYNNKTPFKQHKVALKNDIPSSTKC